VKVPYGETWVEEKASGGVELGYKFTAKELDGETGLYYYDARYYDPVVSRWASADDRFDGLYSTTGGDIYGYVHGNPVKYNDPTGHFASFQGANGSQLRERTPREIIMARTPPLKKEMMSGLKKNPDGSHNTSLGGRTIVLSTDIKNPQKSIGGTHEKTFEVMRDMMKDNKLTEMTVSSLYRNPSTGSRHESGLGVDITAVRRGPGWASPNYEVFRDSHPTQIKPETGLLREVSDWSENDNRINQVLTPWRIWGDPNTWRNPTQTDKTHRDHNDHLHIGLNPAILRREN